MLCKNLYFLFLFRGERKLGLPFSDLHQKVAFSKTFGTIRSVTSTIKSATVSAAASAAGQVSLVGVVVMIVKMTVFSKIIWIEVKTMPAAFFFIF